jgi:hypothetical protein
MMYERLDEEEDFAEAEVGVEVVLEEATLEALVDESLAELEEAELTAELAELVGFADDVGVVDVEEDACTALEAGGDAAAALVEGATEFAWVELRMTWSVNWVLH